MRFFLSVSLIVWFICRFVENFGLGGGGALQASEWDSQPVVATAYTGQWSPGPPRLAIQELRESLGLRGCCVSA